ncbi:hypothetical protein AB0L40_05175 [Patulibacter sp. NPDC049589]|uniref:hypothetical protein n=1 Tax=Patulibacter sp. NPDC049589 TaxID=3154731 RepID=UPI003430575E
MDRSTGSPALPRDLALQLGSWPRRRWAATLLAGGAAALVIGIPTGVVPSSLYHRMTPVTWWDYPIWVVTATLMGLTAATYVGIRGRESSAPAKGGAGGSLLAFFAIGCPICNKLVVALFGVTGTLNYFGPLQPVLGVLSVALLTLGLAIRLRGEVSCPVSPR